jgi:anti-sigma factor RsiW
MTEQDFDLLSAYLDGDLSDADRAALEARLAAEPELRRELEALRQTVALVRSLPAMKAPRSYALNAALLEESGESTAAYEEMPANVTRMPAARGRRPLNWLSAAAAVTVLFVIVAALLVNRQTGLFTPDDSQDGAAVAVMVTDTAAATQAFTARSAAVTPTLAADLALEEAVEPAGSPVDSVETAQAVPEFAQQSQLSEQTQSADTLNEQEAPAQEADAADLTDAAAEGTTLETFSMPGADAQTGASNAGNVEPPTLFMILPTGTTVPTGTASAFDAAPVPQPTQASMGGAASLPAATASAAPTQTVEMARAMPETLSEDAPPAPKTGQRLLTLLVAVLRALAQQAGLSLPE